MAKSGGREEGAGGTPGLVVAMEEGSVVVEGSREAMCVAMALPRERA
jgi:hypothetical protein